ncbi:Histone-lysine N-methyltransferase SUVR2 [Striga hermonthica]|uniref:Histone-lysine N-methyltransferase SUVR2 n=1 Tax=Striga hermonthica TaxID=68872 RepID=A0A9N7N9Q4_STRHE|nr:Histone-lysine N-methyltransferase SUVR2 [Striga hermonthica]
MSRSTVFVGRHYISTESYDKALKNTNIATTLTYSYCQQQFIFSLKSFIVSNTKSLEMSKETKAKVAGAFRAMKALGISEEKVKPVLKNLLKLYDKNWELIEEENYRALADAIFDRDEREAEQRSKKTVNNDAVEQSKKIVNTEEEETQVPEEPEQPLKRLRLRYRDGQTSSNPSNSGLAKPLLIEPKEESSEIPETHPLKINGSLSKLDPPPPNAENTTSQSSGRNKGKQPVYSKSLVLHENSDPSQPSGFSNSPQNDQSRSGMGRNKGKQPVYSKSLVLHENSDPSQPSGISNSPQNDQSRSDSRQQSHSMRLRERGTKADSPQVLSRGKRPAPESSSRGVRLKEPKIEPDIGLSSGKANTESLALIVPKDEPVTDDMPSLGVRDVIIHTVTSNGGDLSSGLREDCDPEPFALQCVDVQVTADGATTPHASGSNGGLAIVSNHRPFNLEVASSPSGEVKFYLSYDPASTNPDFQMPAREAVLKLVEDKCLRSPNTLDPHISMMDVLKEMCQCFLTIGTDCNSQSLKPPDVTPTIDSLSKSSAVDALGAGGSCSSPLNGSMSVYYRTRSKASQAQKPTLSEPRDDVNHEQQQDKKCPGDELMANGEHEGNGVEEKNDLSLEVVVQQPLVTPGVMRSLNSVIDIARGQEKVVITVANDVNDDSPPSFSYIPQNAAYQSAYVNFSLARIADKNCCGSCSGDCLSLSVPCACAHETGGYFAYTPEGLVKEELLKEAISMNRDPKKHCQFFCKECPLERSKCEDVIEPCKGHLVRKFIKECWWKCGCDKQCGNRVVQRGISRNLQVFMTPGGKGWGLRTLEDLPKGAFVCEYVGEVLTNAELFDRVSRSPNGEKHSYPVLLDADWCAEGVLKDEEALCLDATYYGNVARFINHRCFDSTLVEIPVEVETPDHHYYHLAFFTTRKVKAMEELTWDYGIDFDDHEHPIKAFRCQCGSKYCRNIKRRARASRK